MNTVSSETEIPIKIASEPTHAMDLVDGIRFGYFSSLESDWLRITADCERPIFVLGCMEGELMIPALEDDQSISAGDVVVLTDCRSLSGIQASGAAVRGLVMTLEPDLLPERINCFLAGMQLDLNGGNFPRKSRKSGNYQ